MKRSNQPHYKKSRKERLVVRLQNDITKYKVSDDKSKLSKVTIHLENVLKKNENT